MIAQRSQNGTRCSAATIGRTFRLQRVGYGRTLSPTKNKNPFCRGWVMRNGNASAPRVPTINFTHVRKVEPMGSDCIRIYCSVIKDNAWEDRAIIEMPISGAIESSDFVIKIANEISDDPKMVTDRLIEKILAH
jgi:hypothetical protein